MKSAWFVRSRCVDLKGARFRYEYAVERESDGELLADGWTAHGVVDATSLRPTRVPSWLTDAISSAESSRSSSSSAAPAS